MITCWTRDRQLLYSLRDKFEARYFRSSGNVETPNTTHLLLHFDNYMSLDVHVTEMSKKVSSTLLYENRIQYLLSKEARLIAVETLALSHIDYGLTIWSTENIKQLKRVKNYRTLLPK